MSNVLYRLVSLFVSCCDTVKLAQKEVRHA
jgi:hypothetical protein